MIGDMSRYLSVTCCVRSSFDSYAILKQIVVITSIFLNGVSLKKNR